MRETIAEMLKVESEAKAIAAALQAEAEERVRSARLEASEIEDASRRAARVKSAELIEAGVSEAQNERDRLLSAIDEANERLRSVPPDEAAALCGVIFDAVTGGTSP